MRPLKLRLRPNSGCGGGGSRQGRVAGCARGLACHAKGVAWRARPSNSNYPSPTSFTIFKRHKRNWLRLRREPFSSFFFAGDKAHPASSSAKHFSIHRSGAHAQRSNTIGTGARICFAAASPARRRHALPSWLSQGRSAHLSLANGAFGARRAIACAVGAARRSKWFNRPTQHHDRRASHSTPPPQLVVRTPLSAARCQNGSIGPDNAMTQHVPGAAARRPKPRPAICAPDSRGARAGGIDLVALTAGDLGILQEPPVNNKRCERSTPMTKNSDVLALKLSKVYQYERARYEGHGYRLPAYWRIDKANREACKRSIWHRLAQRCQRRNIDPIRFVQWALRMKRLLFDRAPEPTKLLEAALFYEYLRDLPNIPGRIHDQVESNTRSFNLELGFPIACGRSREEAAEYVLLHKGLSLTPLFRYCMALNLRVCVDICTSEYESSALFQYQYCPEAYDECWGHVLPVSFHDRAVRLYDSLITEYDRGT